MTATPDPRDAVIETLRLQNAILVEESERLRRALDRAQDDLARLAVLAAAQVEAPTPVPDGAGTAEDRGPLSRLWRGLRGG